VYKAVLRETGEEVAVKVQRPGIEPIILRDLFIFRALGSLFNTLSRQVWSLARAPRGGARRAARRVAAAPLLPPPPRVPPPQRGRTASRTLCVAPPRCH
jgi:hypothetical protein